MFFIVVNMFIAIINDSYGSASAEAKGVKLSFRLDRSILETFYGIKYMITHKKLLMTEFDLLSQLKDFSILDRPTVKDIEVKDALKNSGISPDQLYVRMIKKLRRKYKRAMEKAKKEKEEEDKRKLLEEEEDVFLGLENDIDEDEDQDIELAEKEKTDQIPLENLVEKEVKEEQKESEEKDPQEDVKIDENSEQKTMEVVTEKRAVLRHKASSQQGGDIRALEKKIERLTDLVSLLIKEKGK